MLVKLPAKNENGTNIKCQKLKVCGYCGVAAVFWGGGGAKHFSPSIASHRVCVA